MFYNYKIKSFKIIEGFKWFIYWILKYIINLYFSVIFKNYYKKTFYKCYKLEIEINLATVKDQKIILQDYNQDLFKRSYNHLQVWTKIYSNRIMNKILKIK